MIESINNEQDHQQAMQRLVAIFGAEKNTPEDDELEKLSALIERYENEQFPDKEEEGIDEAD